MRPTTVGRWLLVPLAILGIALAVPIVSAHGGDPVAANETVDADPVIDRTDRTAWMDTHMATDAADAHGWHMLAVDDMTTQMGHTVDEMTQYMGVDTHRDAVDDHREITDEHRGITDERRGTADDYYDDRTRGHRGGC